MLTNATAAAAIAAAAVTATWLVLVDVDNDPPGAKMVEADDGAVAARPNPAYEASRLPGENKGFRWSYMHFAWPMFAPISVASIGSALCTFASLLLALLAVVDDGQTKAGQ